MGYTIYFPENLANYNFGIAAVIGLVVIVLIVGMVIDNSRFSGKRRRPEWFVIYFLEAKDYLWRLLKILRR